MRGIKVRYNNATSRYIVTDLQNGQTLSVGRDFNANSDNGYALAVEEYKATHSYWGVTHFIGTNDNSKFYAIDESGF